MTRSQTRFNLAVRRTESKVFTVATFTLPDSNTQHACSIGEVETLTGVLRSGGGGRTASRRRTMTVRREVLASEPPAGRNITLLLPTPELWEVESYTSDAVVWSITLKAPNQE